MADAQTARVKYVFMDIVGYTKGRSVEAQSEIIGYLNRIVLESLEAQKIKAEDLILLPTGDGMCIAIIEILRPFDVHIRVALAILDGIVRHNYRMTDKTRKFEIRIGLSENDDNLVIDINGRKNVAGTGINMAQRIMAQGEAGHVLVSESVFTTLKAREQYISRFKSFPIRTKHGESYRIYHYIEKEAPGLNLDPPPAVLALRKQVPQLSGVTAYYFAYAARRRDFLFRTILQDERKRAAATVLLTLLALDLHTKRTKPVAEQVQLTWGTTERSPFEAQLEHYLEADWPLVVAFADMLEKEELQKYDGCFHVSDSRRYFCLLSRAGFQKLATECPAIWAEFKLDQVPLPSE